MDEAHRIEWVGDPARLGQLAAPWRALSGDPFLSPDWFSAWWDAFSDGLELALCLAWRGDELAGVAPMGRRRGRLESLVNDHTPYFDFAVRDESARVALVHAMAAGEPACLTVDVLPDDSPTADLLRAEPARRVVERERYASPIVDTTMSVEEFRAATKHRWNAQIDRLRRKTVREHDAVFHLLESPDDLDGVLSRGFAAEAAGWKREAGTAIISDPATEGFYRAVAHAFADRGELALCWMASGEEIIAFDLSLLADSRLYLLKTGFDERYRKLAPGLVLRLAVIERCIESGIAAHDLLGAEAEWKSKFSTAARRHHELRLYGRGPAGTWGFGYRRFVRPPLRSAYLRMTSAAGAGGARAGG